MHNIYRLVFISLIALYNLQSFAGVQNLVTVTNDEDSEKIKMVLVLNEDKDVQSFQMKTYNEAGKEIKAQSFSTEKAETGVVIYTKKDREIVKLISKNFTPHQGGDVTLDFLYNGITGSRDAFEFDLRRDGDQWGLYVDGKKAKAIHFVSNKKTFVGTIGVKRIIVKN